MPEIWLIILPFSCHIFSLKTSKENLVLHVYQDNIVVFLIRLITYGYFWEELYGNIFGGVKS